MPVMRCEDAGGGGMTLNEIIECIKEVKEDYWEDDG